MRGGDLAVPRPGDRRRRHRLPDRAAARHVRHAAAVRRHRHRGHRGRDLRARRGALGGRASAAQPAEVIPVGTAVDGHATTGSGRGSRGCAAPHSASRSAHCPQAAPSCPTFLSYITEKKLSKHPEEFGKGAIEGVAGPEAANNASAAGTLVPMLSLGLPTNATAAVMLTAFVSYGIQPGPTLFDKEPLLIWTLIASLFIGNFLLLVLNLPLAPLWAKLLRTPRPYLYAGILFFADARRVRGQPAAAGPGAAAGLRTAGVDDAAVRTSGAAVDHRRHPRAADRTPAAAEPAARRWRLGQPVHRARRDHHLRADGDAAAGAAGAEADAPQRGDIVGRRG